MKEEFVQSTENEEALIIEDHILIKCNLPSEQVCVPEGVTAIGAGAFKGCALMKRVILPDSLEVIGEHAFKGCRSLEEIHIPNNVKEIGDYAFHRCHNLQQIRLPEQVTKLGNCAFLYCDSLKTIAMPGVLTLGKQTFLNDVALEELVISKQLDKDSICECFTGCNKIHTISFSDGQTYHLEKVVDILTGKITTEPLIQKIVSDIYLILKIEKGVLVEYLNNVKHIELPEGITEIGKSCFYDKRGIQSVVFPKSLKRIGARAFRGCMNLEKVTFLSEQVELEESAFLNCSSLHTIELPGNQVFELKGLKEQGNQQENQQGNQQENQQGNQQVNQLVETIHHQVLENFVMSGTMLLKYRGCEKKVVVPEGTTVIGQRAFAGNEAVDRIELPDSVVSIEREAFADCLVLQTMKISEHLEKIEDSAFENCVKFIRISIPQEVKHIPVSCFKRCRALQQVILPDSLETIDDMAFYGCRKLQEIKLPKSLRRLGTMSFYGCGKITELTLPKETLVGKLAFTKTGISMDSQQALVSHCVLEKPATIPTVSINRQMVEETLRIPEGIQVIEEYAWFCNESLLHLELPESVKEIKKGAFYGCKNLQTIKFPKGNILLGEECFSKCESLCQVEIAQAQAVGKGAFSWCKSLENLVLMSAKRIEQESFQGCQSLQSLYLNQTEYIGKNAFQFCSALKEVKLSGHVSVDSNGFSYCDSLQKVSFDGKIQLGDFCFQDCGSLTDIEFSKETDATELLTMKSSSFRGCTGLHFVTYAHKTYEIKGYESLKDNILPKQVRQIYASALSVFDIDSRLSLTSYDGYARKVTIPEGIQSIEREVFRDKEGLSFVTLPKSLKDMGARAFDKTEWLRKRRKDSPMVVEKGMLLDAATCQGQVVIPEEIHKICGWAFANDLALKKVVFQKRVKLEEYAFRNCINIEEIILEDGSTYRLGRLYDIDKYPTQIARIARECYNCFKMDGNVLVECTGNIETLKFPLGISIIGPSALKESNLLTRLTLHEEITEIQDSAMQQCKWLSKVEGTEYLKRIGKKAFLGCIRLEEIGDFKALESLGESAFENCISLKEIRLPEGITEIPRRAFYRCSALKHVYLPKSVQKIHETAFAYCPAEITFV